MSARRVLVAAFIVALASASPALRSASGGHEAITVENLREWLGYIASDELEGRDTYSTGLGLAEGFIQSHLQEWGVTPNGDNGGYLQSVRVMDVKVTSRSRVTVYVGDESRTFEDGYGVTFPRNSGGKQVLSIGRVEFAGYGLDLPESDHFDYGDRDVRNHAVVWLGLSGPEHLDADLYGRVLRTRSRYAIDQRKAAAVIGPTVPDRREPQDDDHAGEAPSSERIDFTTTLGLDRLRPPAITADDEFFEFLFGRAPVSYDELKRRASAREPLPSFLLDGVTLTFHVNHEYDTVRTALTHNVVATVRGSDPQLRDTYVAFGAHHDHIGYAEHALNDPGSRTRPPGRVSDGATDDRIWNGADDDGSGTVALMALAKAFAEGPRPKRSLLFVWHAGEERGLWGSRYFTDYPTVPIESIVAQLNADMIGRNREDKASESDTVYLVGSDRISTELHEISRQANLTLPSPLTLDYEMNDPFDREQLYYRSDHYSYAAKGIPVIFFTTGLHVDYHANTDHVSKIEFNKMARITQLLYETGMRLGNLDHPPVRDRKGPRAGKGIR
jgi:hypothetical protein